MPTTKATEPEYTAPAVHTSLLKILKELSVAKNGTLPSNMGGKAYLTAVDVARETKTLFVEEGLIILPNETVIKHDSVILKDRINVLISIEGQYEIISTRDGSSVTITGVGDGLAGGTAVASNIASTNALKNGLLRTFLITEQSVEDAAKSGPPAAGEASASPAQRKVDAAKATATAAKPAGSDLNVLKGKIRDYIGSDDARRETVNSQMTSLKEAGLNGLALHERLVSDLKIS